MAPKLATARLRKELIRIKKEPFPGLLCAPLETDILEWYYVIRGAADTPYEGGHYFGKLKFPSDYPMKPPSIYMLTPSGRFEINKRLCLSMSDFHPETWNPMWSVGSILTGLVSFMNTDELTTGGMRASSEERSRLAVESKIFNTTIVKFGKLFPDVEAAFREGDAKCEANRLRQARSAAAAAAAAPPPPAPKMAAKSDSADGAGSSSPVKKLSKSAKKRARKKRAKEKAMAAAAAAEQQKEGGGKDEA